MEWIIWLLIVVIVVLLILFGLTLNYIWKIFKSLMDGFG